MNKNDKINFWSFLVASICFYIIAVTKFIDKDTHTAVVFFCLGSAFLCLSATHLNKNKKEK